MFLSVVFLLNAFTFAADTMARLFVYIYDYFAAHRKLYWLVLILSFLLVSIGAMRIKFQTDINQMIPHDANIEAMNNILNHTKAGEQVIFTMHFQDSGLTNPEKLVELQQQFVAQLDQVPAGLIRQIQSVQSEDAEQLLPEMTLNYLPVFLEAEDYRRLDSICAAEDLTSHFEQLRKILLSPAGVVAKQYAASDPLNMVAIAMSKFQQLHFDPNYELYSGYIFDKHLQKLSFFVQPAFPAGATDKGKRFVKAVDEKIEQFLKEHPDLTIRYFGGLAVAAANADQMQTDTIVTLSLTIVLLLLLTYYVFRRKRISLILIVPVLFGALFGMSITALLKDEVAIIAIGAGAIILGIAVDFAVHFMSHTRHSESVRETVKNLSNPLTLGAITTIGAFFALRYANAPLLQDLGTFASFALLGASLFTLVMLPHFTPQSRRQDVETLIDKLAEQKPEGNKWLLALVLFATPILWYFSGSVGFQSDLMQLNYMTPQLKAAQEALNKDNTYALSALYMLSEGNSEEDAMQSMESRKATIDSLVKIGWVHTVLRPTDVLPSVQEQELRIQRWQAFWNDERINALMRRIQEDAGASGFAAEAFADFESLLRKPYNVLDSNAVDFIKGMLPGGFAQKGEKHYSVATLKINPGYRNRVLEVIEQVPDLAVTDRQYVSERLLELLKTDFNRLLFISGGLVFLALLIAYGRIELALMSFLPMAVSWIWITGLMGLLGLEFNVVNIVIATLLFGLGDDYSIFMMDSLMEKYRTGQSQIKSARSAVYLSVLTTIIGLGTLVFAKHPALQSIAFIAILGLICVVFIAQVLQPFLFNALIQHRADKGFMPFTLLSLLRSVFAFLYFTICCFFMVLAGLLLVKLRIIGKERGKYVFHWLLSKCTGSVIYVNHSFKQKIHKHPAVNFETPAVYIANHSSFLDMLFVTMMHPKVVLLTNKWVYQSPVFGAVVKMADYYPVANGAEESIKPLRNLVENGYSIVVFPEGTRSKTDKIGRFHKGAFYIAEQLKLDIVPILLHGVHYKMQKGDFLLKRGPMYCEILAPISYADPSWGETVRERTKSISRFFKENYQQIKQEKEHPGYFRQQLIAGNKYKGPVLEWYCSIKTKLENNYEVLHQLLPREGLFYDLGCGYGFAAYMLHWASEGRHFVGVDYDEDKIITAAGHYKKTDKIRFSAADITSFSLEPCTGILISDVLHYLPQGEQFKLLDRCWAALQPGGVLIVRDGIKELATRHKGTERSEWWSTKVLQFNKTHNKLNFIYLRDIKAWAATKGMSFEAIDNTTQTSNVLMVMHKKQVAGE